MRRLKIALVTPEHPNSPRHGGIARYLRDYAPALAAAADVVLVSTEAGEELAGVPQHIVSAGCLPSPLAPPGRSRRIQDVLRRLNPDIVEYPNWGALGCCDRGHWTTVTRISTPVRRGSLRPGLMPRLARPLHHFWESQAIRRTDFAISHTNAHILTCEAVYGQLPPVKTIALGVNLPPVEPLPGARGVLFVGRFEARKGLDVLIEAWRSLSAAQKAGLTLHLVGRDTPGRSGSYLRDCLRDDPPEALAVKVHHSLNEAELARLRQSCHIAVVPSRYESFGMVVLEAFAFGHAVIASAAGGLPEVVRDGEDGLLVAPEDVAALARALARLGQDEALAAKLATAGRQALATRFSVARMVEASLAAYEVAVAGNTGGEEAR